MTPLFDDGMKMLMVNIEMPSITAYCCQCTAHCIQKQKEKDIMNFLWQSFTRKLTADSKSSLLSSLFSACLQTFKGSLLDSSVCVCVCQRCGPVSHPCPKDGLHSFVQRRTCPPPLPQGFMPSVRFKSEPDCLTSYIKVARLYHSF